MILAIADLHGHVDGLINAIETANKMANNIEHVVLLGDYMDNGPHVPELISHIIKLQNDNKFHIHPIMGNHDLMGIYNMELGSYFNITTPRAAFNNEALHYYNSFDDVDYTPLQYYRAKYSTKKYCDISVDNEADPGLDELVPDEHKAFFVNLPLYCIIGNYFFVHAGLTSDNIADQITFLNKKDFSELNFPHIPVQLRGKKMTCSPEGSTYIVVSGHNKLPCKNNFASEKRIILHSESCNCDKLHCVLLPNNMNSEIDHHKSIFFEVHTESSVNFYL